MGMRMCSMTRMKMLMWKMTRTWASATCRQASVPNTGNETRRRMCCSRCLSKRLIPSDCRLVQAATWKTGPKRDGTTSSCLRGTFLIIGSSSCRECGHANVIYRASRESIGILFCRCTTCIWLTRPHQHQGRQRHPRQPWLQRQHSPQGEPNILWLLTCGFCCCSSSGQKL